jgi:hypothetical protein
MKEYLEDAVELVNKELYIYNYKELEKNEELYKSFSGWAFGISSTYNCIYGDKININIVWVYLLNNSELLAEYSNNEKVSFITRELENFENIAKYSEYIVAGKIKSEKMYSIYQEEDYDLEDDILKILIKNNTL